MEAAATANGGTSEVEVAAIVGWRRLGAVESAGRPT
jgi:hypothetical protein